MKDFKLNLGAGTGSAIIKLSAPSSETEAEMLLNRAITILLFTKDQTFLGIPGNTSFEAWLQTLSINVLDMNNVNGSLNMIATELKRSINNELKGTPLASLALTLGYSGDTFNITITLVASDYSSVAKNIWSKR